jgi:hypothetical protein
MPAGKGGGLRLEVAALCLIVGGAILTVAGRQPGYRPPPLPPPSAAGGLATVPGTATASPLLPARRPWPAPMLYSTPVRVDIPAIGVHARVVPLGENPDGSVTVPPLSKPLETGWYNLGPAPGQPGPAALVGHVDSAWTGPAVFYRLGDLRPGDVVSITRADHRVAVFRVYAVTLYPKDAFPTRRVYGPTADPELRLITCGGPFDQGTGSYLDNTVAFAHLTAIT